MYENYFYWGNLLSKYGIALLLLFRQETPYSNAFARDGNRLFITKFSYIYKC